MENDWNCGRFRDYFGVRVARVGSEDEEDCEHEHDYEHDYE